MRRTIIVLILIGLFTVPIGSVLAWGPQSE